MWDDSRAHLAAANDQDVSVADLPGQDERSPALDLGIFSVHDGAWGLAARSSMVLEVEKDMVPASSRAAISELGGLREAWYR